jgi:HK97 gp10 family phage protein
MATAKAVSIDFIGDKGLARALKRLPITLQKKIVRPALRKGFKVVFDASKAAAPVGEGRLKRKLKLRATKRSRGGFGVRIVTPPREQLDIPPGAKGYYPAHIELGTQTVAARPFLRSSFDAHKDRAVKIIAREIAAGLKKDWTKK